MVKEKLHNHKITLLEFNNNNKYLISGDENGLVIVWNIQFNILKIVCD